ncbi:MAG: antitoxin MazE family protein [Candidatus Binatia bacterium]
MRANRARGGHAAVRRYREKMKRQGMRLVQFWAPDTNAPGFAEECRRQSLIASSDRKHERQILREIGELSAGLDLGTAPDFDMPRKKK